MPTPIFGTSSTGQFSCATDTQHSLRDLRTKRKGQPVFVLGHVLARKGQEGTFEVFNDRLALVKFSDGGVIGYDPLELLLPPLATLYLKMAPGTPEPATPETSG